jgi:hypothetical protein
LVGDNDVHGSNQAFDDATASPVLRFGGPETMGLPRGLHCGLVAVPHCVPEVDENVKVSQRVQRSRAPRLQLVDEREPQPTEIRPEGRATWVLGVQLAVSRQKTTEHDLLAWSCHTDMNGDSVVVKLAAVALELGDQHDQEAPIELLGSPAPAAGGTRCLDVDQFELGQSSQTICRPRHKGR